MSYVAAEAVACPGCGAEPDAPCVGSFGDALGRPRSPHSDRIFAYIQSNQPTTTP